MSQRNKNDHGLSNSGTLQQQSDLATVQELIERQLPFPINAIKMADLTMK